MLLEGRNRHDEQAVENRVVGGETKGETEVSSSSFSSLLSAPPSGLCFRNDSDEAPNSAPSMTVLANSRDMPNVAANSDEFVVSPFA